MSKVEAYICDHCGNIFQSDEVWGISPVEDLFDMLAGYPSVKNPAKAACHCCIGCFRMYAIQPAENECNRRYNEEGYQNKLRELYFNVRKTSYLRYSRNTIAKKR